MNEEAHNEQKEASLLARSDEDLRASIARLENELLRRKKEREEKDIKTMTALASAHGWTVTRSTAGLKIAFKKPRRGRPRKGNEK